MKKILAAAIAATLVAPAAFANDAVTVYGNVHNSVDFIDGNADGDFADVVSRVSTLGFKGSEDLGDGLKAVFKIETEVGSTNGTKSWAGRNTYVGLAGDFGTVLVGRHDSPLKMSTGKLEMAGNELGDYEALALMEDNRLADVVAYVSPNFSGFTFTAATAAGADFAGDGSEQDDIAAGWAVSGTYSNAGLYLALAYEDKEDHDDDATDELWRAGIGYTMDAFTVGFVYENADDATDGELDKFYLGGKYKMGNNTIKAAYGMVDYNTTGVDDTEAFMIGFDHSMSKRTRAYIQYADSEHGLYRTNANGGQDGISIGMQHKF